MQRSLAERLRVLRARKGLSLLAASEQLGVDRHTLRDLELGQGRTARYPTLAKIAAGYGVPVEDLLEEPGPKIVTGSARIPLPPEQFAVLAALAEREISIEEAAERLARIRASELATV